MRNQRTPRVVLTFVSSRMVRSEVLTAFLFCFLVMTALSILGDMALPDRALPGLPEGQAG